MKLKTISLLLISTALSALFITAQAQDIKVPVGEQSPENQTIDRPKTGAKKAAVLEKFGQPIKENLAVGKPPISSLEYEKFTVYLEGEYVIYTVLKPIKHETKEVHAEEEVEMPESSLKPKEK